MIYGRHSFCREHRGRPAAGDRRGPPSCSTWRSAAGCTDLGNGGRRRWHVGHHADRRTSGSTGATSDNDGANAGSERRSRSGLSGPPANARSASDARCASDRTSAECAARAIGRTQPPPPQDPIATDRKRREYESLFASNVVLSPRPENERPDVGRSSPQSGVPAQGGAANPSVDDVADAVVRASTRTAGLAANPAAQLPQQSTAPLPAPAPSSEQRRTPDETPAISAAGPLYRVLEGTVIDTVLTNRLDGSGASPVNCLVTSPLYSHTGRQVLIPAGARILGETKPVQAFGETRLAVSFHRLLLPDGHTYRLDQFLGLNQIGTPVSATR